MGFIKEQLKDNIQRVANMDDLDNIDVSNFQFVIKIFEEKLNYLMKLCISHFFVTWNFGKNGGCILCINYQRFSLLLHMH